MFKLIIISNRTAFMAVLLVVLNNLSLSNTVGSNMNTIQKVENAKNSSISVINNVPSGFPSSVTKREREDNPECGVKDVEDCGKLPVTCFTCNLTNTCNYGDEVKVTCNFNIKSNANTPCKSIERTAICRYCYQTEIWEHVCEPKGNCRSVGKPVNSTCMVNSDIICLGNRKFPKKVPCNWTQGYRWSTTLILSITLGGFGVDRFYLGHWQEGIGKLFSFGGLGVWTLIDVLLISLHYLGPADGSLYL